MERPLLDSADDHFNETPHSQATSTSLPMPRKKKSTLWLAMVMLLLICMGVLNFVLVKAMYDAFGSEGAFFANQGVNLLYVVYGGVILGYKFNFTGDITRGMRNFPQSRFFWLACLDAFGTFFTAMGALYTPLFLQQILNQTLIPLTMVASFVFLRVRYAWRAVLGAVLIFCGAAITVAGTVQHGSDSTHFKWYAAVIYFMSNVPMALSAVYKEVAFKEKTVDVWYLCWFVSTYQFLVSFVFVPLLSVPFVSGSENPPPIARLPGQFLDGAKCWIGAGPCCCSCASLANGTLMTPIAPGCCACPTPLGSALWLLPGYTLANFLYNAIGLFITKHGSAVLRYISYALILPLATIAGGPIFQEKLTVYVGVGLVTAITGFSLYQRYHALNAFDTGSEGPEEQNTASHNPARPAARAGQLTVQASFQERVIGMGFAHRFRSEQGSGSSAAAPFRSRGGSGDDATLLASPRMDIPSQQRISRSRHELSGSLP